jgi:hypothetical protein
MPVKVYKSNEIWQFVIGFLMIGFLTLLLLWTIQDYLSLKADLNATTIHCFSCSDASRSLLLLEDSHLLASAQNQIYFPGFDLALCVGVMSLYVYAAFCLRMYVCTEGLLKVFGRSVIAIRWDDVAQVSWRGKAQVRFLLKNGKKYTWLSWGLHVPEFAQEVNSRLGLRVLSGQ